MRYSDFPRYLEELITRVEIETGKPLRVVEVNRLRFDAQVIYAHKKRKFHLLRYVEKSSEHMEHFIVNSCIKILRMWNVCPENRYIASTGANEILPDSEHSELLKKIQTIIPELKESSIKEASSFINRTLINQLTTFPQDLRVEREISENVVEARGKQKNYIISLIKRFPPSLDKNLLSLFPGHVYKTSTAMNIAFIDEASRIIETDYPQIFKKHGSRDLAEELISLLRQTKEPGVIGDKLITDAWARVLGMEGRYDWITVESD